MSFLLNYFENRSPAFVFIAGILVTCIAGIVDLGMGPDISTAIFYVVPISMASWYGTKNSGIIISVFSAVVWGFSEKIAGREYASAAILYWNAFVRLALFFIISYLFSSFREKLRQVEALAAIDSLTGILNSRAFYAQTDKELKRSKRFGHRFTIAYIDLDNFKYVNDTFGHLTGDQLLRKVALTMKSNIRNSDCVARLGGDEFAILFIETDTGDSMKAFLKVHEKLQPFLIESRLPVSFSAGMVTYEDIPDDVNAVVAKADELMYSVKKTGKNGIIHAVWKNNALTVIDDKKLM